MGFYTRLPFEGSLSPGQAGGQRFVGFRVGLRVLPKSLT